MTFISPIITIDGPSGSGKGTICKALAKILRWNLLDSGSIYRILVLSALHNQIDIDNENKLVTLAKNLNFRFELIQKQLNILLEDKNVNQFIYNETIGKAASRIAVFPRVREALLWRQRQFYAAPGLIADGRDMGTVVFPNAQVKIFLNASSKERAHRRMLQLQRQGFNVKFDRLLYEIKERDDLDYNRAVSPLVPASDAILLDSSTLSIKEVILKVLKHASKILALS